MAEIEIPLPIAARDVEVVYGPLLSKSRPGVKHYVFVLTDGSTKCTCEGYKYRQHCVHIDMLPSDGDAEFDVSLD